MNANGYTVSYTWAIVNWAITLLLGSLFPVCLLALSGTGNSSDAVPLLLQCIFALAGLMLYGAALLLLPLGLLLLLVRALNQRSLPFEKYMVFHNLLHLVIALVSFTVLDFLLSGAVGAYEIVFLGVIYTTAGLLVWNASFLISFARKKSTW
jgi:hypothetical protein